MKASKTGSILSLVIMGGLGLLLIFFPGETTDLLIKIVGIGLIIYGGMSIVSAVMQKDFKLSATANMVGDVCAIVIGLICFLSTGWVMAFFHVILGAIITFHGITLLLSALELRDKGTKGTAMMILSIASIVLGVLILTGKIFPEGVVIIVAGVVLLYNAILGLWETASK